MIGPSGRERQQVARSIAFVDLAGFTALTQAHGDDHAADVHDAFVDALTAAAEEAAGDVECVKQLGDGALLASGSADALVLALRTGVARQHNHDFALRVRAGVHVGTLLAVQTAHGRDYLGHTVNVAARLCSAARPGELLLSEAARRSAPMQATSAQHRGARQLRHVREPVEVWSLTLGEQSDLIDPVCHMTVGEGSLALTSDGQHWRFCSDECRESFRAALPV